MKQKLPYIIAAIIALAILALLFSGSKNRKQKIFDQRITLRKQDKIPYGTYAAYKLLKGVLPKATIHTTKLEPGYWDSISTNDSEMAYIYIGNKFTADEYEMHKLIRFAASGNDVFISASYLSAAVDEMVKCNSSSVGIELLELFELKDSMTTSLISPFVKKDSSYFYPGLTFNSYFTSVDTTTTDVLGTDEKGRPTFIHLAAGKGHVYLHLEPLAFSNYFILFKNNIDYYEKAISVIKPNVKKIIWDEYFATKKNENSDKNNRTGWFRTLMGMENNEGKKSFKWAFWVALLLLLLFVLMEMRRKQRYIPVVKPPKNDSLDFVKTIGRLYYDKGNHKNLCRKMAAYFLEYVRTNFKISTSNLDENFVNSLQYKSGADEAEIRGIVSFIKFMDEGGDVDKEKLMSFHTELESFYKKA